MRSQRNRGLGLLIALWCAAATATEIEPVPEEECDSLARCLDRIPELVHSDSGISSYQVELAKKLQSFGADAVPHLIALLSAPDEATRDFAGYTLIEIDGLGPEHVAPIVRAALQDEAGGWFPRSLARIGTPEAIAGLASLVRKYPTAHSGTQLMDAFASLGAKGAPALVRVIEEADRQEVRLGAGEFLGQLGPDAGEASVALAKITAEPTRSQALRLDVLRILGGIGAGAAPARDLLLQQLRSERGDYQQEVAAALAAIGGTGLGEVYAAILAPPEVRFDGVVTDRWEQIESDPYEERLSRVGLLRERGRDAIPPLVRLLDESHPNLRVHAARVLGFVGDASAGPHLVALIRDQDWLMVNNAVEALGRIGYASARDEIALVARTHWIPGVRKFARDAVAALDGQPRRDWYGVSANYFDLDLRGYVLNSAPEICATPARYPVASTGGDHFGANRSPERAKQFAYKYEAKRDRGDDHGNEDRPAKTVLVDQIPDFGHRGPGGWFLGASRGERGGELVWRPDDGRDQVIVKDNIEDVHELSPGKFVVTAGLDHGAIDSGHVYRLEAPNGRWRARWWLRLPGAPIDSWMTQKGDVVINTTGGSVVLDLKGTLRMADCTVDR